MKKGKLSSPQNIKSAHIWLNKLLFIQHQVRLSVKLDTQTCHMWCQSVLVKKQYCALKFVSFPFCVTHILILSFFPAVPSPPFTEYPVLCPVLAHLPRWDRWRWEGLSPCRPSRWATAGWQKWTPSRWVGRSQRCASVSGWGSAHLKRSWCPGRGCTSYRCARSDGREGVSQQRLRGYS